ncbi:30S ribosome-binding factor RbfA [Desertihabitans brevis]|uniref:Ribosome-binding factor A n=1 Tax=Desertihabitans brevis TaxID=2268447 RepID=A0A367YQV7_9ACTN|nr:30S ribosome-binding factor RbfA [Desertihabitans brevis]RCK68127.1 30S ribosome-binding factor RbfA [Desertihabitans brevis]
MPSPRVLKLADQIKVITAQMLERRIKDPRLGFVTVTDCRLTGDSRDATVFYTVYGSEAERAGTAAALASATGLIRSQIGKQLGLRHTPSLVFVEDAVPEAARHFEDVLAEARSGDAAVAARAAGASYAGEADPYKKPRVAEDEDEDDDEPVDDGPVDDEDDRTR